MQTQIPVGSPLAKKIFGAALFAAQQRANNFTNTMIGSAPVQSDAEAKLTRNQSSSDMPIVRITDLQKSQGDRVTMDLISPISGGPIMGDANIEGQGTPLSFSTMEIRIDLASKVVDAGGSMTQQRTVYNIRKLAQAVSESWMKIFDDETTLVHLAGARGSQAGVDWKVPVQSDPTFASVMVNPVLAPSYNRHYVVSGNNLVQGGAQLGSIASTDLLQLQHLDQLRTIMDDLDLQLQPVKIADDPAAEDEPMYVMWCTPRLYASIRDSNSGQNIRAFQQYAFMRASYGSKHPLFKGEVGMWNNILVKKLSRAIRFNPGDSYQYVAATDSATGNETTGTINSSLTAGYGVERAIIVGAQALGYALGKDRGSGFFYSMSERLYNHERNLEIAVAAMCGKAKVRFAYPDPVIPGNTVATDHGVFVIDAAVPLATSI